jgi:hypothetical protein
MRRVVLGLVLVSLAMGGEWRYRVYSPVLGILGTIRVNRSESATGYRVDAEARTRGVAALLTGGRTERYRSEGVVKEGRWYCRHFRIRRKMKGKRQIDDYRIDPKTQKVTKEKIRRKEGKPERRRRKNLSYFTEEDLATLYRNEVPRHLTMPPGSGETYRAVGAEKAGGKVTLRRASDARASAERKRLEVGEDATILLVASPGKILGKRNRTMVMAVDREGVLLKARLTAIPVVGEIFVERVPK